MYNMHLFILNYYDKTENLLTLLLYFVVFH